MGAAITAAIESAIRKDEAPPVDIETHDVIPLKRRGNLYYLRAWIRAAPNAGFGWPR